MTSRGHLACGFLAVGAALPMRTDVPWSGPTLLSVALVFLFGTLAPDLDMPQSYLGRRAFPLPYLVRMLISNPLTWLVFGRATSRPRSILTWIMWPFDVMWNGRQSLRWLVRHRGFSHSALAATLAGAVASAGFWAGLQGVRPWLSWDLVVWLTGVGGHWDAMAWASVHGLALTLGCLVHDVGDACTVSGVPLWLPFNERKVHVLPKMLRLRTR